MGNCVVPSRVQWGQNVHGETDGDKGSQRETLGKGRQEIL